MFCSLRRSGVLFLFGALLAVSACGGSSATSPGTTNVPLTSNPPSLTASATPIASNPAASGSATTGPSGTAVTGSPDNTNGLDGAASAFADVANYKFSMTLAGGNFADIGKLGGASGGAFTISGTVIATPAKAADIKIGSYHIVEVGGFDYIDLGVGGFIKAPVSGQGMADSFSPNTMFSSVIYTASASGYNKVGSETKNGVMTDHFQASASALSQYDSLAAGATWTADVWLAQNGGYPVSMNVTGTAGDGSVAYQIIFDISNINDPANTVTVPTNVTG
jgi:hypothetical protein